MQNGVTPLHDAARLGNNGAVKALLAAGADPLAKSHVRRWSLLLDPFIACRARLA